MTRVRIQYSEKDSPRPLDMGDLIEAINGLKAGDPSKIRELEKSHGLVWFADEEGEDNE